MFLLLKISNGEILLGKYFIYNTTVTFVESLIQCFSQITNDVGDSRLCSLRKRKCLTANSEEGPPPGSSLHPAVKYPGGEMPAAEC